MAGTHLLLPLYLPVSICSAIITDIKCFAIKYVVLFSEVPKLCADFAPLTKLVMFSFPSAIHALPLALGKRGYPAPVSLGWCGYQIYYEHSLSSE